FGYPFADAVAAVIVALMIAKIGLSLVLESLKELVDTSLPDSYVREIRGEIMAIDGVRGIHLLRTRKMGEDAYLDVHIVVNPRISVSEGHLIADFVRDELKDKFDDIVDVLVHIDPEDDQYRKGKNKLPAREKLVGDIKSRLGVFCDKVEAINIHYLEDGVELEMILPYALISRGQEAESIRQKCLAIERDMNVVSKIWLLFKM
ncbi:MAG: cation diffusion facilitator family transporter, partial [Gammaproteobacteria bacterium]